MSELFVVSKWVYIENGLQVQARVLRAARRTMRAVRDGKVLGKFWTERV